VPEMLSRLMAALLRDRPDRPVRYMRDYVTRERDGLPHPPPREPTPEPEPELPVPPPGRIQRSSESGLPPLRSYYGELIRAKWFAEPEAPKVASERSTGGGLQSNDKPVRPPLHTRCAALPAHALCSLLSALCSLLSALCSLCPPALPPSRRRTAQLTYARARRVHQPRPSTSCRGRRSTRGR
jgi:hypothetical protein